MGRQLPKEIIYEYEMTLIGKRKEIAPYYFRYGVVENEQTALKVIRYALETYLQWEPERMYFNLTIKELERLNLLPLLGYVQYPMDMPQKSDMKPLIAKLYPKQFRETENELVIRIYNKMLATTSAKYPREFFVGNSGRNRANCCLQYALNRMPPFNSVREIYEMFSRGRGNTTLRMLKLNNVCGKLYDDPLDFLHDSLPGNVRSTFWYKYYKFHQERYVMAQKQRAEAKANAENPT